MSDLPIVCQNVVVTSKYQFHAKNLEKPWALMHGLWKSFGKVNCELWPVNENIHKLPFCVYRGSESQLTRNTEVDY